jgi:hypothetical protein
MRLEMVASDSPRNGRRPVASSQTMAPRDKISGWPSPLSTQVLRCPGQKFACSYQSVWLNFKKAEKTPMNTFSKKAKSFSLSTYVEQALKLAEYEKDENGFIVASVPNISGFFSQGENFEEARVRCNLASRSRPYDSSNPKENHSNPYAWQ